MKGIEQIFYIEGGFGDFYNSITYNKSMILVLRQSSWFLMIQLIRLKPF